MAPPGQEEAAKARHSSFFAVAIVLSVVAVVALLAYGWGGAASQSQTGTSGASPSLTPIFVPTPSDDPASWVEPCPERARNQVAVNPRFVHDLRLCLDGGTVYVANIGAQVLIVSARLPGPRITGVRTSNEMSTTLEHEVVRTLIDSAPRSIGGTALAPGQTAVVEEAYGAEFVGIAVDRQLTLQSYMGKVVARWVTERMTSRPQSLREDAVQCARSVQAEWLTAATRQPVSPPDPAEYARILIANGQACQGIATTAVELAREEGRPQAASTFADELAGIMKRLPSTIIDDLWAYLRNGVMAVK